VLNSSRIPKTEAGVSSETLVIVDQNARRHKGSRFKVGMRHDDVSPLAVAATSVGAMGTWDYVSTYGPEEIAFSETERQGDTSNSLS
jgi:hypothetical protein